MVVVWGTRDYGTCDKVPGLFHVTTIFYHLYYIPIIPFDSYVVHGTLGRPGQSAQIPYSLKSILLAWTRTLLLFATIVTTALAFLSVVEPTPAFALELGPNNIRLSFGIATALYLFVMVYPRRKLPSYDRAVYLAGFLSLNETQWAALNALYGKDPFDRPPNLSPRTADQDMDPMGPPPLIRERFP